MSKSNPMWGGRFDCSPNKIMEDINASISFDKRLAEQDILASKVHCSMLAKQKIISDDEARKIAEGLDSVLAEISSGKFLFKKELEDIHMNIESRLNELIGSVAGKLHTARSRNDQVATDFKLWVRDAIDLLLEDLDEYKKVLINRAEQEIETIMPGFTHLQNAQPVSLGHHLLAYVEMAARDRSRLIDCRKRLNQCPLGSAALAGTVYPIDRNFCSDELGFDEPTKNSLDAVSDRDFALEFLACLQIYGMHLSRLAEEFVIWSSYQFQFIQLGDDFTTGSSIMPQKKNPDAAELIRAKSGRILASFNSLSVTMKSLPLAYSKDMQEDKEVVFDAFDQLCLCVRAMTGMLRGVKFNSQRMLEAARVGFPTATDLADYLVQKMNIPFREAHHCAAKIVHIAEQNGVVLEDLSLSQMREVVPEIDEEVLSLLSLRSSMSRRDSYGGTSPRQVKKQLQRLRQ